MNIVKECRYMYRVPTGSDWYVTEYYGCCTAISMADARKHLRGIAKEIVRVRLGEEGCHAADDGDQEYRKELFEAAMKIKENDRSTK